MEKPEDAPSSFDEGVDLANSIEEILTGMFERLKYSTFERQWFMRGFKERLETLDG